MKFPNLINLTKRLFGALTKGNVVAKEDVVQAGFAAIQAADEQVLKEELGKAYDAGLAEAPAVGGFQQADIDAAVQAAKDADAQTLAGVQAQFDAMKVEHEALIAKEGQEASVIAGLQASLEKIKAAEALLAGLFPAPVDPAPVTDPDPQP